MASSGHFLQSLLDQSQNEPPAYSGYGEAEEDSYSQTPISQMKPIHILKKELLPTVMPCVNELLKIVKADKEYEREKLNCINWMVEFLYKNNPRYKADRENMELLDIPFVQKILAKRPQAPLPLHLRLTKSEAATLIQAGVRGYMARQADNVQGFREKIKRKQAAATVIQSGWRGHKVRQRIADEDLNQRDTCNVYRMKSSVVDEEEAEPAP
eukprot:sb/3470138/